MNEYVVGAFVLTAVVSFAAGVLFERKNSRHVETAVNAVQGARKDIVDATAALKKIGKA